MNQPRIKIIELGVRGHFVAASLAGPALRFPQEFRSLYRGQVPARSAGEGWGDFFGVLLKAFIRPQRPRSADVFPLMTM